MSLKTCFIGSQDVGKTSIITRISTGQFPLQCAPTIGASYSKVVMDVDDHRIRFQIWDTAGQERFRSVASMYYRKTDVAIVVYDITNAPSYDELSVWLSELRKYAEDDYLLCIVGNKSDLASQRVVERDKAEAFAEYLGALYFETSAKTGEGIMQLFEQISRQLINSKELREKRDLKMDLEQSQANVTASLQPKPQRTFCCF